MPAINYHSRKVGNETCIVCYPDNKRRQAFRAIARWHRDPSLNFGWLDRMAMAIAIMQTELEAETCSPERRQWEAQR